MAELTSHFEQHSRTPKIYRSLRGLGVVLGAE